MPSGRPDGLAPGKRASAGLDGKISRARFGELDGEAEERPETIDTGIAALAGKVAALGVTSDSSEGVIRNAGDLYGRWDSVSHEDK